MMKFPIPEYTELDSYKNQANLFFMHEDQVYLYNDIIGNLPKLNNLYNNLNDSLIQVRASEDYTQKTIQVSINNLISSNGFDFESNIKNLDKLLRTVKVGKQFPVIRNKLIVELNYQIERRETMEVIKLKSDRLVIRNLHHYIMEQLSQDNTFMEQMLVTNYQETLVHIVTEYLHGNDHMVLRIKDVRLYFETIEDEDGSYLDANDYYHFTKDKKFIVPHKDFIENDHSVQYHLIPLQTIPLDYLIDVNTNDQLTFTFNIWRKGLIVGNNTRVLYDALMNQLNGTMNNEFLVHELEKQKRMLYEQQQEIQNLFTSVNNINVYMKKIMEKLDHMVPTPPPPNPPNPGCSKHTYMVPPYGAALDFRCNVKTKELDIFGIESKGE